ncbi:MAG: very short patch repair endonuclease [Xanthobacteraceae bacterium]
MVDHVSRSKRSSIMRAVRGRHTAPEILVRKAAHRLGLRFRLHMRGLPGRPDLVFPKWRTVVFVNGCFWHRHPGCKRATTPKSNVRFWKRKLAENIRRDAANYAQLAELSWKVIVLWQCEVKTNEQVSAALRAAFPRNASPIYGQGAKENSN